MTRLGDDRKSVFLRDEELPDLPEFEVSLLNLAKHTQLRHALTSTITIHDAANTQVAPTHTYVGLSRGTDKRALSVERT